MQMPKMVDAKLLITTTGNTLITPTKKVVTNESYNHIFLCKGCLVGGLQINSGTESVYSISVPSAFRFA